jgi:hypothetical protein
MSSAVKRWATPPLQSHSWMFPPLSSEDPATSTQFPVSTDIFGSVSL